MPAPSIVFDARLGRFRFAASGRLVSAVQVRAELDRSLQATSQRLRLLGDDLRAGRISLDAWRMAMRADIKAVSLRSAALARGGWNQMDPQSWGRVGQQVKTQYAFLEKWTQDIKAGAPLDGTLNSRSAMYALSGRNTFFAVQREEMLKRGMAMERSIVNQAAESCAECVAEAARGLVPLGSLIPPGQRTCLSNCRCAISYSREEAA